MEHEALIRRVLGANFLDLKLGKLAVEEDPEAGTTTVKLSVIEGESHHDVEGKGVGVVDAIHAGLLARYAREYQSLTTLRLIVVHVVGMKKHGFVGYWKSLVPSGLPGGMVPAIFIV